MSDINTEEPGAIQQTSPMRRALMAAVTAAVVSGSLLLNPATLAQEGGDDMSEGQMEEESMDDMDDGDMEMDTDEGMDDDADESDEESEDDSPDSD